MFNGGLDVRSFFCFFSIITRRDFRPLTTIRYKYENLLNVLYIRCDKIRPISMLQTDNPAKFQFELLMLGVYIITSPPILTNACIKWFDFNRKAFRLNNKRTKCVK